MSDSPLRALVISHIGFEDLGTLRGPLLNRSFTIDSVEVASSAFPFTAAADSDLLVILGGPIGVYQRADYPFLQNEIVAIAQRLDVGKPTLGICLWGSADGGSARCTRLPWRERRGNRVGAD